MLFMFLLPGSFGQFGGSFFFILKGDTRRPPLAAPTPHATQPTYKAPPARPRLPCPPRRVSNKVSNKVPRWDGPVPGRPGPSLI